MEGKRKIYRKKINISDINLSTLLPPPFPNRKKKKKKTLYKIGLEYIIFIECMIEKIG